MTTIIGYTTIPLKMTLPREGRELSKNINIFNLLIILALAIAAGVTSAAPPPAEQSKEQIPILKYENEGVNHDGSYNWNYETGNNIIAQEQGEFKQGTNPDEGEMEVRGSYEYTDPDGKKVVVTYIANKDGFQPQGDILPTPPPIPPAIQKLLEWLEAHPEENQAEENKVR
ncbi:unnamed protein product [Psylliodes chrysocephalus]|uniref:Uncharacterized protein n=1 Tax=Psylliodes chrysocephalus TaxID=3402493 RepID=A0A9P0CJQ5_9CUCU|nr:unnamed protein product [Psylliodes chrysocephala]